jgi:hypothetical protein
LENNPLFAAIRYDLDLDAMATHASAPCDRGAFRRLDVRAQTQALWDLAHEWPHRVVDKACLMLPARVPIAASQKVIQE